MNPPETPSSLQTLTRDQQAQIAEWIEKSGMQSACDKAREQFKINATLEEMGDFHAWHHVARHLARAVEMARWVRETISKSPEYKLEDDTVSLVSQVTFEMQALTKQDEDLFIDLRKLRQKDRDLELETRKLAIHEGKAKGAEVDPEEEAARKMTREDRERRLREIFGLKP
jgi:hypothetical protein